MAAINNFIPISDCRIYMSSVAVIVNIFADEITGFVYKELTKPSEESDSMYIDCKYYTATVKLKKVEESESKSSINGAEAVVLCFELHKPEALQTVQDWLVANEDEDIPIRLLVCKALPNDMTRADILKLATDKHFEVIQLFPDPDEMEEDEEYGISRILSALIAHQWPNLILKAPEAKLRNTLTESPLDKPEILSMNAAKEIEIPESNEKKDEKSDEEEFDDETFSELFPRLMEMRSKTAGLDFDKRHKMAEKLTVRFWRSMKLDEEEISGLSDDGED